MAFTQRAILLQRLQARADAIAEAWYHALLPTGFSTRSLPQLRQELGGLTESLITALLTEPFAPNLGDLIGVALANLGLQSPESLRATLTVLPEALVANLANARLFETRYAPLFDDIGSITGVIGVSLDITERPQPLPANEGPPLTVDEQVLLGLLATGRTNRQIGQELGLGSKAVEKRLAKLFARLGVATRTEAVALAFRDRLLDFGSD